MFTCRPIDRFQSIFRAVVAALIFAVAGVASADVLFFEDFEDTTLATNAMVNANVTVAEGIARFSDPAEGRATFTVVQPFTAEVMTFSFDVVEPIVQTQDPTRMEVILRAGTGTAHNTLANADQVVESIIFRGGNRMDYVNNGNETIFLVANNKASNLVFNSPIDNSEVTLLGFQYIPYVKNNANGQFGLIKGISNFNGGQRPFERFGIGSSTNSDVGTFAIDNVQVVDEVLFTGGGMPTPSLGLQVNPVSGNVTLQNNTESPIALTSYSITSVAGSLNVAGWNPISNGNELPGEFPPDNGTSDGLDWEVAPNPSDNELVEWYLTGDSQLLSGQSLNLGNAFTANGTRDLTFRYTLPDNTVRTGTVAYSEPPGDVPGDYNDNGTVDAADYVLWRNGGPLQNEVSDPGTVSAADYSDWRARFGNTSGSGSSLASVPEPATIALLLVTLVAGLAVCRSVRIAVPRIVND